jgi:hypothetical protein
VRGGFGREREETSIEIPFLSMPHSPKSAFQNASSYHSSLSANVYPSSALGRLERENLPA